MGVKRIREDGEVEALDAVNCLMLLSKVGSGQNDVGYKKQSQPSSGRRVFVCKTCNRQFNSFQALGGHRASHKKPKLTAGDLLDNHNELPSSLVKPKTHECSICGLEFAIGQALGGHMRRHRHAMEACAAAADRQDQQQSPLTPVLKKSSSSKRVMCLDLDLDLDLNLAPPGTSRNDDLKLQLMAPMVDRFMYKSY